MTTPEGKVKAAVKKVLAARNIVPAGSKREMQKEDPDAKGWYYMPVKGTSFGVNGIHDFVGCANGLFFSIETKAGKGVMSAHQEYRAQGIRRGRGAMFLVTAVDDTAALDLWLSEVTADM